MKDFATLSRDEKMLFWQDCENRLRAIIILADAESSPEMAGQWGKALKFLDHNENGLALSEICWSIHGRQQSISPLLAQNIKDVAELMDVRPDPLFEVTP
jgi:hypothetical protein